VLNGVGIDVPIHALDAVEKALAGEHHVLFSTTAALQNVLGKLAGDFDDRLQITTSPRQPPNAVRGAIAEVLPSSNQSSRNRAADTFSLGHKSPSRC
jgi:hypothetical protein